MTHVKAVYTAVCNTNSAREVLYVSSAICINKYMYGQSECSWHLQDNDYTVY